MFELLDYYTKHSPTHRVISHLTRQLLLSPSQTSLLSSRYISWYTNVMILIRTVVITFFNSILILNYLLVNFYSKIIALINYRKVYSILEQQCYCRHFIGNKLQSMVQNSSWTNYYLQYWKGFAVITLMIVSIILNFFDNIGM